MFCALDFRVVISLLGACAFVVLLYCRTTKRFDSSLRGYVQPQSEVPVPEIRNNISYAYVVGLEGTGHRAVAPVVARVAESCGYRVIYDHKHLRRIQQSRDAEDFQSAFNVTKTAGNVSTNVLVIEDAVFPLHSKSLKMADEDTLSSGAYDINWSYEQLAQVGGIRTSIIFLNRNFYRTVSSRRNQYKTNDTFALHAQTLYNYTQHIYQQFHMIDATSHSTWREVHYEWFTELSNCPALVRSLTQFLGMQNCDIEVACEKVHKHVRKETNRIKNTTEEAIARTFNVSSPIPLLDYKP